MIYAKPRLVEIFLPIFYKNKKTNYMISDAGNVKNIKTGKLLSHGITEDGYHFVGLYNIPGRKKVLYKRINVLVAEAFIPNPENKPTVNHEDGNKDNNYVENLSWATHHEQNIHAFKNGLMKPKRGENSHFAKYDSETAHKVCRLLSEGVSIPDICKQLNIPRSFPKNILKGAWPHIRCQYSIDISKIEKGNSSENTCLAKLNWDVVHEIRDLYKKGYTYKEISDKINHIVSRYTIGDICKNRTWKE